MSDATHGDEARRALDDALAYFRPHPYTNGPVMLTPEKMRAHLAVIEAALRAEPVRAVEMKELPRIEFHQQDFIPGFAAFLPSATTSSPDSKAFCVLNLGSMLSAVDQGDVPASELPYLIAESMMHEVMHVLEQWADAEFSENRVDALIEKYRAALPIQPAADEGANAP